MHALPAPNPRRDYQHTAIFPDGKVFKLWIGEDIQTPPEYRAHLRRFRRQQQGVRHYGAIPLPSTTLYLPANVPPLYAVERGLGGEVQRLTNYLIAAADRAAANAAAEAYRTAIETQNRPFRLKELHQ
jgi:hypothetical protein